MRQEQLVEEINKKRNEMINTGMALGLDCEKTIQCSQELDQLLNEYNSLLSEPKQPNPFITYLEHLIFMQQRFYQQIRTYFSYY
jgi:Spo0E like sporulation regulatory protein